MADLTNILGGPWSPEPERRIKSPEEQLLDAILAAGLAAPEDPIKIDGEFHRFASRTGKRRGYDKAGWYVAYPDSIPSGRFGCWRIHLDCTWQADIGRKPTPAEQAAHAIRVAEAKAARDAALVQSREAAATTAQAIWDAADPASPDHPYLVRKGVRPHGIAKVHGDGRLILPLCDADGELASLQYIAADGDKRFHPGGQVGGRYCMIGALQGGPGTLYVAEGFATAATVAETTNRPCAVAYNANNLGPVMGALRERYGLAQDICIVADNDESGVGLKAANEAADQHGARVIMPPIVGMDANDYAQAGHDLGALLMTPAAQTTIERLKVVFGDQLSTEYEAPDELVEGLMTIGSSVVVYGDSNSGKTFWALSVATAIATGTECYGRKTDPGLVVYLATEAPASIRARMQAIKKFHGCELENLAMVPVPMNFYSGDRDAQDVIALVREIEEIKGKPVRLIIADTLARISAGANENSGEDMGPVMARFDAVATATGAAMMIIHHNGKDAARGARGWSGIRAHIDTEIEIIEKDGIRSANVTKQRELPGKGEAIYFKLEVIEMGLSKFGAYATTCVAISDDEASEAQPHKKNSKHDENVKIYESAWWASGAEEREGSPYLSRDALKDWVIKNLNYTERTARNKTESSRKDSIVHNLILSGNIRPYERGWLVINEVQASVLLSRKAAR